MSGPVIGNITFAPTSAQKAYNCPRCLGLVLLGQICPCQSPISVWAQREPPHCPTCTCGAAPSPAQPEGEK